jgi:FkbH-like protein
MVIWDLDETFWGGTLTEGGITWRPENADIVRTLAQRGIVSTICSKNDPAPVQRILEQHGLQEYFVFADISWGSKGPRLAALVQAVQLRAESLLFIDDNPANRAEAAAFVPGLQIAGETIISTLANHSLLQGKPDPEMTRLAQYRLLERRHGAGKAAGSNEDFLRASGITVAFKNELEPHLDRVIELINRTNQLNFTKRRLPEDPQEARAELRKLLAQHNVQAGLLRVRDHFGDHGFAGFYALRTTPQPHLVHFAFSCRILGMGVETWLYRHIGRPTLRVAGEVLSDPIGDSRAVDWIGAEMSGAVPITADAPKPLRYILARGACDMRAVAHYCHLLTESMLEEFAFVRGRQHVSRASLMLAVQAMDGFPAAALADFAPMGLLREDVETALATGLPPGPGAWLMGFSTERDEVLFRHKATGALLPNAPAGLAGPPEAMMRGKRLGDADPALVAHMREKFEYFGHMTEAMLQDALRKVFSRAAADVRVFVTLSNTEGRNPDGSIRPLPGFARHNDLIRDVAADHPNVELILPRDFMTEAEHGALIPDPHHFDRMVYFRIFQHIASRINANPMPA